MARIRSVKPEFFTHPEIVRLSMAARLLLLSLLTQADDFGRLYDQPTRIRGEAFGGADKVNISKLLDELVQADRIRRYQAEGRHCILILNFSVHQKVSHPTPSRIPPEPLARDSGTSPERLQSSRAPAEQGAGSREQGAGKETSSLAATAARSRDESWEAFVAVTGITDVDLTATRRKALNGMLKSLKAHGGTPQAIQDRAREAVMRWPGVPLTPEMLVKHWAELGTAWNGGPTSTADRILASTMGGERGPAAGKEARGVSRRGLPAS